MFDCISIAFSKYLKGLKVVTNCNNIFSSSVYSFLAILPPILDDI